VPSKSAKQHNFMAAIANNPAFAKKVGVSQSVGKDYAAADKGKKFAAGGALAKVNKPDTKHGAMDMPFKSLKKFTGMKSGGKVRRFQTGGSMDPDYVDPNIKYTPEQEAWLTKGGGRPDRSDRFIIERMKAARPTPAPVEERGIGPKMPATRALTPPAPAPTLAYDPDQADKEVLSGRFKVNDETGKLYDSVGDTAKSTVKTTSKPAAKRAATNNLQSRFSTPQLRISTQQSRLLRDSVPFMTAERKTESDAFARQAPRLRREGFSSASGRAENDMYFKKGGTVDTKMMQKGMTPKDKMMAMKSPMRRAMPPQAPGGMPSMMKKGGMPMKDGKPAFMKKMNMGGTAKYAAGGSVGSASRRADGIAQRGKTKAKMV
jgi:hypothetical protein